MARSLRKLVPALLATAARGASASSCSVQVRLRVLGAPPRRAAGPWRSIDPSGGEILRDLEGVTTARRWPAQPACQGGDDGRNASGAAAAPSALALGRRAVSKAPTCAHGTAPWGAQAELRNRTGACSGACSRRANVAARSRRRGSWPSALDAPLCVRRRPWCPPSRFWASSSRARSVAASTPAVACRQTSRTPPRRGQSSERGERPSSPAHPERSLQATRPSQARHRASVWRAPLRACVGRSGCAWERAGSS